MSDDVLTLASALLLCASVPTAGFFAWRHRRARRRAHAERYAYLLPGGTGPGWCLHEDTSVWHNRREDCTR